MIKKTLKNVAEEAQVSVSVASRVLGNYGYVSEELKKKVLKAAKKINYSPNILARSLKTTKTHNIGVIICDIATDFGALAVRGINDVAHNNRYYTIICNSDEDPDKEREHLQELINRGIDGIILSPTGNNVKVIKDIIRGGLPIVLIDRTLHGVDVPSVTVDNRFGSFKIVEHMIKLGSNRIAVIKSLPGIYTGEERFKGYLEALESYRVIVDTDLIKYGNLKEEDTIIAIKELLDLKSIPDSIFITSEAMIASVLHTIKDYKLRIPKDIKIAAFDDPAWASILTPPLTTVKQPCYSIGIIAAQNLIGQMNAIKTAKVRHEAVLLKPEIVIRESCGEKI